jgi:competence protein ComFC
MKIIKLLKDILSPKKCYSCNKEWHFLCLSCYKKLDNFEPICYVCKNPSKNFEIHTDCLDWLYFQKVIILTHYKNEIIKRLITDAKFYKRKDIFEDFWNYLTKLLIKYEKNVNKNNTIIVPIPIHFFKKLKRGYNQTEVLSQYISNRTGLNMIQNLLIKNKYTGQQSHNTKIKRQENLNNSLKFNNKYIDKFDNYRIVLIDDVISTGSTLNEASKILNNNWFKNITCLVIASD